jgi:phosphoribosyl-ATP pyrophosphohydrolase/phosphoribosyl-AMP cyclohydrolase
MVIASIDIQSGKVVQLKQGSELVLQREDPQALAAEFDRYGEVAVIDLDAALGRGNNSALIKPLLHKAQCRVGGGIRTVEQARELISLGAQKIILGSQAFRSGGGFAVNTAFLETIAKAIGRERIIVAVDARITETGKYHIVVDTPPFRRSGRPPRR